jgi:hypothetical protein
LKEDFKEVKTFIHGKPIFVENSQRAPICYFLYLGFQSNASPRRPI